MMNKSVFLLVAIAMTVSGCSAKTSSSEVKTDTEKAYSLEEVESIKQSVAESVENSFMTNIEESSLGTNSEAADEGTSDPWENGTLETMGLGDMPKPKNYKVKCIYETGEKRHPKSGDIYPYKTYTLQFSEPYEDDYSAKIYNDYGEELWQYFVSKDGCYFPIGWGYTLYYKLSTINSNSSDDQNINKDDMRYLCRTNDCIYAISYCGSEGKFTISQGIILNGEHGCYYGNEIDELYASAT